ncbi:MAG: hypothetical protein JKY01_00005 [Pseudomonadales bacterium]|nr:hypothetical protein [Pseudomonadales bacterium]
MRPKFGRDEGNEVFHDWLVETCPDENIEEVTRRKCLINWQKAPVARYAHPREEHLLPLYVVMAQVNAQPV